MLADELFGLRFVEWRASQEDAVGRTLQELARIDANQLLTEKLRTALGFREVHGPNAAFEKVMREVSDAEVAAWYALHKDTLRRPREIHARHLRVADEQAAWALLEKLRQGADFSSFRALPVIDCRDPSRLSELERTIVGLPPRTGEGEYSPPLLGREGFDLIRLDRVLYEPTPLAEARWSITFQLAEEKVRTRFEALRQRLRARAKIELHPDFTRVSAQGAGR